MNKKTVLKFGKIHIWVCGPNSDPYRHMYYKTKTGERGLRIFPKRWPSYTPGESDIPGEFKKEMSIVWYKETSKWFKWYLEKRADWHMWEFFHSKINEHMDGMVLTKPRPWFIVYLYREIKKAMKHDKDLWD